MKGFFSIICVAVSLSSCFGVYYDKDFYERVSGIKIPSSAKAIETVDNGEFVTATSFELDSLSAIKFIHNCHLRPVIQNYQPHLWSANYLTRYKPIIAINANQYFLSESKGRNDWVYLIDINKKIMWAEIRYPDWGGR